MNTGAQVGIEITSTFDGTGAQAAVAAQKQLTDESARYQATLQRMAEAQEEVNRTQRLDSLRARLQAHKEQKQTTDDLSKLTKTYTAEEIALITAQKDATQATERATLGMEAKKRVLGAVLREYPLLRQAAMMALNPITGALAGIAGGFAIFGARVRAATQALAGLELPDLSKLDPQRLHAAAKAWDAIAKATKSALDNYNSIPAVAQRAIGTIEKQADAQKKLLEQNKALELARLEASKADMTPEAYARATIGIEDRYRQAGIGVEKSSGEKRLRALDAERFSLIVRGENEARKAKSIKIAGKEYDATTQADMDAAAAAAKADRERRVDMIDALGSMGEKGGGIGDLLKTENWSKLWKVFSTYGFGAAAGFAGPSGRAMAAERAAIDSDLEIERRAQAFRAGMPARDKQRAERDRAASAAGDLTGQGIIANQKYGEERASFSALMETAKATARAELIQELYRELARVRGSETATPADVQALIQRIARLETRTANRR